MKGGKVRSRDEGNEGASGKCDRPDARPAPPNKVLARTARTNQTDGSPNASENASAAQKEIDASP